MPTVWHTAHVSPLHSVNMSEGAKHTSSRLGTQSTMRNQIPGPGREAKGIPYLTEWRLSFSFPGAGSCQRELWILNLEGSSSIYYFQIWESKARRKVWNVIREGRKHIFTSLTVARQYFYVKWKAMELGKMHDATQTEILQTPCLLLSQTLFPPPKWNGKKKKIEITKRTAEILAGQLMSDRSVTPVKKIKRGKKKNGFVKNSEVL